MQRIDDDLLKNINGGIFKIFSNEKTLVHTADKGLNSHYEIIDYDMAMETIKNMQLQNIPEDEIIAALIAKGYLAQ